MFSYVPLGGPPVHRKAARQPASNPELPALPSAGSLAFSPLIPEMSREQTAAPAFSAPTPEQLMKWRYQAMALALGRLLAGNAPGTSDTPAAAAESGVLTTNEEAPFGKQPIHERTAQANKSKDANNEHRHPAFEN